MIYTFYLYHFSLKCIIQNLYLFSDDPLKQTFETRRWGRVGETGGPAHADGVAIWRSSNA